jgi:hypothetical protein
MASLSPKRIARVLGVLCASVVLVGAGAFIGTSVANATSNSSTNLVLKATGIIGEDAPMTITSTSWTLVKSFQIPTAPWSVAIARFTAETRCLGGGYCSVKIDINGNGAFPNSQEDFTFDSPGGDWESHSVERFWGDGIQRQNGPTVQIYGRVVNGATSLRLDDWTLTVTTY